MKDNDQFSHDWRFHHPMSALLRRISWEDAPTRSGNIKWLTCLRLVTEPATEKKSTEKICPSLSEDRHPSFRASMDNEKKMQTPPWVEPNTGNHPGLRPKLGGLPAGPIVGPCWSQTSTDQWFFHGVSPLVLGSSSRSLDVKTAKTAMDWIGCFPHHQKGPISAPENRPGKAPGWIQRPEKRQGAKT
jgi:hypothetical protein